MRIYDPRIGKFLSVDPIANQYPELIPYQFASNSPIESIDLDGLERQSSKDNSVKEAAGTALLATTGTSATQELAKQAFVGAVRNGGTQADKGITVEKAAGGAFAFLGRAASLTLTLVFSSLDAGKGSDRPYQRITNDPAKLSDFEIQQIKDRISRSEATAQDLIYKSKIDSRLGQGNSPGLEKLRYDLGSNDADLRGSGINFLDALKYAFEKTVVDRKDFTVTKWGTNEYGKSFPVEYTAKGGAEVSIDFGRENNGPDKPHVGWKTPGKGKDKKVGHIIVDYVPAGRTDKKP
ncbi:polymorphic toxin type 47 domain-containing protein [Pedobacter sp. KLB.chiD]|uniref:polymorphic toxin type 47 domain-containing protein n=1 Tax=Pedobacter sp. KLB.chiD TaxID=3387402 RepID=UPI00399AD269